MADSGSVPAATPLSVLTHAIARLAGARGAEDVVEILRTTARRMMGCQGIAVIRKDADLCHYIEEDAIGALWKGQKFPASACVSGWAMAERRTIVIPDIDDEPRVPHELYHSTFVRAIVMAPIGGDEPIGAIGAYWAMPYAPSRSEVEMLEALASAAATAIENVRLIAALSTALDTAELARDELRHRVKNAYMGAESLVRMSLGRQASEEVTGRIQALSRAQAFLDDRLSKTSGVDLRDLVALQISPYRLAGSERFLLDGPALTIDGELALPLGLAINELATNALKHGALSAEGGTVAISWSRMAGRIAVLWQERGGPPVVIGRRAGEGSSLLSRLVERQMRGRLEHRLAPEGVVCTIRFAVAHEAATADILSVAAQ